MDPVTLTAILETATPVAAEALTKVISLFLAEKGVEIQATDKDELVAELLQKADAIRGDETPEQASSTTRRAIEGQITILERERSRLTQMASREHIIAQMFAIVAGSIFLGAIAFVVIGSLQQAVLTLLTSIIPGFLSRVFYSRETGIEDRIEAITTDLRQSERAKERLALLEEALAIVPAESKAALVSAYTKQFLK